MKTKREAKHIYFFIGTTAELIKVMPVAIELSKQRVPYRIISSGQNVLNMKELESIFGKIKIYKAFKQKKSSDKTSMINFIRWSIETFVQSLVGLRKEFKKFNNQSTYLIVHGDTVSSLIGALIGKICRVRVVHVESGLRSFHFLEPFPEEICRYLISYISDIHFSPNAWALKNLKGLPGLKVNTQKNVVVESLYKALSIVDDSQIPKPILHKKYFMLMMHRQEHVIFNPNQSKVIFLEILNNIPKNMKCVVILHALTESFLNKQGLMEDLRSHRNVITIPRQSYPVFAKIMERCEFMISDGGSTQEEAYYLGKPCLIIRNRTERIEGLNKNAILAKGSISRIKRFMKNYRNYRRMRISPLPLPSKIVADLLISL